MFQKSTQFILAIIGTIITMFTLHIPVTPAIAHPTTVIREQNEVVEQQLLASTLRIELHNGMAYQEGKGILKLWGVGHGTVKEGRYFVTHNHFDSIVFNSHNGEKEHEAMTISFYRADGSHLKNVSNHVVVIAGIESETLTIDFGEGFFDELNVPSASFMANTQRAIQPNVTVAQINWNNAHAFVEWTTVRNVTNDDGTAVIKLDNSVIEGASGGGIFLNGQHIGNNWKYVVHMDSVGEIVDEYSVAALNNG